MRRCQCNQRKPRQAHDLLAPIYECNRARARSLVPPFGIQFTIQERIPKPRQKVPALVFAVSGEGEWCTSPK